MAFETQVETIEAGKKVAPVASTDAGESSEPLNVRLSAWPIRVGATPATETKRYIFGRALRVHISGLHSRTK